MAEEAKQPEAIKAPLTAKEIMDAANRTVETPAVGAEGAAPKKKRRGKKKSFTEGRVYVHASYNNTIITVTDPNGNPAVRSSAGMCGFKGTRKSTPYAAQVAAEKAMEKAKLMGLERARAFVKGVGVGRDQAIRAVAGSGVELLSITDLTGIPFGGCRARKARRV